MPCSLRSFAVVLEPVVVHLLPEPVGREVAPVRGPEVHPAGDGPAPVPPSATVTCSQVFRRGQHLHPHGPVRASRRRPPSNAGRRGTARPPTRQGGVRAGAEVEHHRPHRFGGHGRGQGEADPLPGQPGVRVERRDGVGAGDDPQVDLRLDVLDPGHRLRQRDLEGLQAPVAQGVLLAEEGGDPRHGHRRGGAPLQAHGAQGALRVRIGEGVEPGRAVALGDAGLGEPPAIARVRAPELHRGVHHQRPGSERLLPPRRPRGVDLEPPPHRLGVLRAVAVLEDVRGDLLPRPAQARRAPARRPPRRSVRRGAER